MSESTRYTSVPLRATRAAIKETNVDSVEVELTEPETTVSNPAVSSPTRANRRFHPRINASSNMKPLIFIGAAVGIVVLLILIIVPMSFSTLEYYEVGFKRRKSTGLIDRSEAFGPGGRYMLGPDYEFYSLPSEAHFETFKRVTVFAKDRLQITVTAHMQYFLRKDQMNLLHKKYDTRYRPILYTNALNTLKNKATSYTTREFIRDRHRIENYLFLSLRDVLSGPCCEQSCSATKSCVDGCKEACQESEYAFFVDVRYFQLDEIDIPNDLENKFLRGLVLTEETEAEDYKQDASVARKTTAGQVKQIENEARQISQDATSQSELVRSIAKANATSVVEDARSEGLKHLYSELQITDQKQKASFDYLRTLRGQENIHLAVHFQQLITGNFPGK